MPDNVKTNKVVMVRSGLLVLLVTAVYATTLTHGFVWDDAYIIVSNPLLAKLGNIPKYFLSEDTAIGITGYYRPMTYISFAMDRAIWGLNPIGYHITNLVLQIMVVLLFYATTAALFKKEQMAFVAALIFALHPIAGETINFLSGGRNTLLSACFALLSLLFYINKKHALAIATFIIAIFSKEFALLLPFVFLYYDFRMQHSKGCIWIYCSYLVSVVFYLTLRSIAVQKANFISQINLSDAMAAPYLVVRYILNLIFPMHLKIMYDVHPSLVSRIICMVLVVLVLGVIFVLRKRDELCFSLCWLFLFLLPVINIIPLDSASLMADRYAYFSLMGFALCLATVICRWNVRIVTISIAIICSVYSYIDITRNNIWKEEAGFFTRMTQDAPDKFDGYQNLGMYYFKKGNLPLAVDNLALALSKPDIPAGFLVGSASVFWKENLPALAEKALLRALKMDPSNPEPYLMLIVMYERSGDRALGATYRDLAERLFHGVEGWLARRNGDLCREGESYMSKKLYLPAENVFWQALMSNPNYIPALVDMGSLKIEQGDLLSATNYLEKAISLDPLHARAHRNLSTVFTMQGRMAEAGVEMKKFMEAEAISKQKRKLSVQ